MDELATKAALKEEHDDNSDTDDMPLLEDVYDTVNNDNRSLGEKEAHEEPVQVKKESPEAAQKREAVYAEMIAAWKASNQAEDSIKEAHEDPAEVKSAPRKETVDQQGD